MRPCVTLFMLYVTDQLPRLGKRELVYTCTCNYVVSIRRGFLFLLVLGMGWLFNCGTPWALYINVLNRGSQSLGISYMDSL